MPIIEPYIPTQRESHEIDLWEKEKCYRFYVKERHRNCTFREIMNLWLEVPYCSSCATSNTFLFDQLPDISGRHWRDDLPAIVCFPAIDVHIRYSANYRD